MSSHTCREGLSWCGLRSVSSVGRSDKQHYVAKNCRSDRNCRRSALISRDLLTLCGLASIPIRRRGLTSIMTRLSIAWLREGPPGLDCQRNCYDTPAIRSLSGGRRGTRIRASMRGQNCWLPAAGGTGVPSSTCMTSSNKVRMDSPATTSRRAETTWCPQTRPCRAHRRPRRAWMLNRTDRRTGEFGARQQSTHVPRSLADCYTVVLAGESAGGRRSRRQRCIGAYRQRSATLRTWPRQSTGFRLRSRQPRRDRLSRPHISPTASR